MEIRKKKELDLMQHGRALKVVDIFEMSDAKSVTGPMTHHFKLFANQGPITKDDKEHMRRAPYASAVGSLMYLMVCTIPDLAY